MQPLLRIRQAARTEWPLLSHLHLAYVWCVEMAGQPIERVGRFVDAVPSLEGSMVRHGCCLVAETDDAIVGAVGWAPLDDALDAGSLSDEAGRPALRDGDGATAVIRLLTIHGGCGRFDVARRLLFQAEADMVRAGHVFADTFVTEASIGTYRSIGYETVRRLWLRLDDGEALPVLHLRKALPVLMDEVA